MKTTRPAKGFKEKSHRLYVDLDENLMDMLDTLCNLNRAKRAQVLRNMIFKQYSDYSNFLQKKNIGVGVSPGNHNGRCPGSKPGQQPKDKG
ncbi:MAG: hypothetical protein HQK89_06800 [Nitrospirae bacterium]|nr:hypothetical protein [Nitrospirota bacterium]